MDSSEITQLRRKIMQQSAKQNFVQFWKTWMFDSELENYHPQIMKQAIYAKYNPDKETSTYLKTQAETIRSIFDLKLPEMIAENWATNSARINAAHGNKLMRPVKSKKRAPKRNANQSRVSNVHRLTHNNNSAAQAASVAGSGSRSIQSSGNVHSFGNIVEPSGAGSYGAVRGNGSAPQGNAVVNLGGGVHGFSSQSAAANQSHQHQMGSNVKFSMPNNWKVFNDENPNKIIIVDNMGKHFYVDEQGNKITNIKNKDGKILKYWIRNGGGWRDFYADGTWADSIA